MGLFFLTQKADTLCPSDSVAFSRRNLLYHQSHSIPCVQKHRGHVKVTKLKADSFQVISARAREAASVGTAARGRALLAPWHCLSEIT